jgi:hypothetical protein
MSPPLLARMSPLPATELVDGRISARVAEAVWRLLGPWHPITPPLFPIAREILLPACMVLPSAVATSGCTAAGQHSPFAQLQDCTGTRMPLLKILSQRGVDTTT